MQRSRTILVADDIAMFRELAELFLARSGRVLTAEDGSEAFALARQERPDLVIADAQMPGMDGLALCRAIKGDDRLSNTPVVIVLSENGAEDRARAVRAGADDLLTKPMGRVNLIETVNRFLSYPEVRGLTRVEVEAPVRFTVDREQAWGTMRNLSRGGLFMETEHLVPPETELLLHFALPDREQEIEPTAEVVWQRREVGRVGMGVRFLAIDHDSLGRLEDFVFEQSLSSAPLQSSAGAPA